MPASPVASVGEDVVQVIPSVLWAGIALIALFLFRDQIRTLLGRVQSARLPGGAELSFGPALEGAVEKTKQVAGLELQLAPQKAQRLLNRARRHADAVVEARVLWVDDEPEKNAYEREAMDALGIHVKTARSTAEAEFFLERGRVDLVISNQVRREGQKEDREAGYTLRERMHTHGVTAPLILYIMDLELDRPASQRIFAVTNRPDELLDYVIDALAVRRTSDDRRP